MSGGNIYQYLAALSGNIIFVAFGANIGWTSPYLLYLTSDDSVIPMTSEECSWVAIAPLIGCSFGAALVSSLPDKLGRKKCLLCLSPIVFICYVSMGFVRYVWYLFVLKFIIGLADGAAYTVLPMYIGEIADPSIRDLLNTTTCCFFIVGVMLINIIGSFFSIFTSSMICAAIPVLHFSSFIFMPESPYYYIMRGNIDEAKKSLMILKETYNIGRDADIITEGIEKERNQSKSRFTSLIKTEANRSASLIFMVLVLAAQCSGKFAIMIYTQMIFEESGSSIGSTLSTVIYNLIEIVVMLSVVSVIVSKIGKRTLILASTTGSITTTFLFGLYFQLKDMDVVDLKYVRWLPLALLICYNISYSSGLAFGPYTYLSELFPSNIKSKATCMAEIVTVLLGASISKFFQSMFDYFGTMAIPFFCFSALTAFWMIFIIKLVPEIHGKSLQEIQDILNKTKKEDIDIHKLQC